MPLPAAMVLTKGFEEKLAIASFKIIDNYWDCCIVGGVTRKLINHFFHAVFRLAAELTKFSIILLILYSFGFTIFSAVPNEERIALENAARAQEQLTSQEQPPAPPYPYVVEIPSKFSIDSVASNPNNVKPNAPTTYAESARLIDDENEDADDEGVPSPRLDRGGGR